jgi:hypothetical protein
MKSQSVLQINTIDKIFFLNVLICMVKENVKMRCIPQKDLKDIFSLMHYMSRVNHV